MTSSWQALGKHEVAEILFRPLGIEPLRSCLPTRPDGRVVAAATAVRRGETGAVDIDECASTLGVHVRTRALRSPLLGLTSSADHVALRPGLTVNERRFVLAHELAHILIRRGQCSVPGRGRWIEEAFADSFARELLLPCADLRRVSAATLPTTPRIFGITHATLLLQLAVLGLAPSIMRLRDGLILCVKCGDRPGNPACSCRQHRSGWSFATAAAV